MSAPTRPILRWHGGKWVLAPWIIGHFPHHRIYVEPFGGAASVMLRKPRAYAEVYNDLDGDLVNLFRVMRDRESAAELFRVLALTPFARDELALAGERCAEPIERARRLIARSFMGFGSDSSNIDKPSGFRSNSNRSGSTPAHDWRNWPEAAAAIVERLQGVVVENRPAMDVSASHDGPDTLHYLDPPYVIDTRTQQRGEYQHEMTNDDHEAFLAAALALEGMVVISGYAHPLYEARLSGWRRVERPALADGARPRIEVLWLNPAVERAHDAAAFRQQELL